MHSSITLSSLQQTALVVLRTLVGWHFLYEGYTKLLQPAWGRAGAPLAAWSSAGYLKAATGPLADMFHSLGNASWIGTLDLAVASLLVAVGLSLMLGLFTQAGCIGALGLLALFYLSAIPMGLPEARAEGTYLIVNKNLIEAAAVLVLWSFRTGLIAGVDQDLELANAAREPRLNTDEDPPMNLTPEQIEQGRRNFLKVLAGTPALAALGMSAALKGPVRGGPVRVGFIGVGSQGRSLLGNVDPAYAEVRALCDINPNSLKAADEVMAKNSWPAARHYVEWQDMLQKEDLEAVIMAPPLWAHADLAVGCLDAGKHVLCEKMMAWDVASCERMLAAARRNNRVLEIAYQRQSSPMYQAAYDGIIKTGTLGDVYHVRLAWHRNGSWRRKGEPPAPDYSPAKWGYPDWDHLLNWRLYWKYSQGLMAELCSHQINAANWFLGAAPEAVVASGGVYRFPEGNREVFDHVYATFDYPGGRTAMFSSIESNAFDDYYEMYMGTKGTLIINREQDALLFEEGSAASRSTAVETTPRTSGPAAQSSETMSGNTRQAAAPAAQAMAGQANVRVRGSRIMIQRFCSAVRVGTPLPCGPDKAFDSARACIRANEAVKQKARLTI